MTTNEISTLATLGNSDDDTTCSMLAAKSLHANISIKPYSEFELAIEALQAGHVDSVLVPVAYPHVGKFIMDDNLVVISTFMYNIPALVFASECKSQQEKYYTLFNHPATNPLMKDILYSKWETHSNVSSNTIACLKVLDEKYACCAITNAVCAQKYGLHIHQVLRNSISMPFVIFAKKHFEEENNK